MKPRLLDLFCGASNAQNISRVIASCKKQTVCLAGKKLNASAELKSGARKNAICATETAIRKAERVWNVGRYFRYSHSKPMRIKNTAHIGVRRMQIANESRNGSAIIPTQVRNTTKSGSKKIQVSGVRKPVANALPRLPYLVASALFVAWTILIGCTLTMSPRREVKAGDILDIWLTCGRIFKTSDCCARIITTNSLLLDRLKARILPNE